LPIGAFERAPWPDGSEDEALARTDLNLLRPTIEGANRQMTRRELTRKHAAVMNSERGGCQEEWPGLIPATFLKMSRCEKISLTFLKILATDDLAGLSSPVLIALLPIVRSLNLER
jgi:hypothetical protein